MTACIPLSHGIWCDGRPQREVGLRALAGTDEQALAELPDDLPISARASVLLARTITSVGTLKQPEPATAGELSIGDRERLLLHLFAATFAPRITLHSACVGCGEEIDAPLEIKDLMVPPIPLPSAEYEVAGGDETIRVRLPRGVDQEAVAALAGDDLESATDLFLRRCLVDPPADLDLDPWIAPIEQVFAELDPQAETIVQLICPSCGAATPSVLDAAEMIFSRLAPAERLLDEVHAIARHYHWSERTILALPTARRRAYLTRIAEGAPQP